MTEKGQTYVANSVSVYVSDASDINGSLNVSNRLPANFDFICVKKSKKKIKKIINQ